jgi:RNA polymerase-binding transcription factor DksA
MAPPAQKPSAPKKAAGSTRTSAKKGGARTTGTKGAKKAKQQTAKKPAAKSSAGKKAATKRPPKQAAKPAKKATKKPATKRPAPKNAPAKKPTKATPAAKAAPVKKAAPAKKAAPVKKVAPAKAAPVAKKAPAPQLPPVKKSPPRKPGSVICPLSGWEVMPAKPNLSERTLKRLRAKLIEERNQQLRQADDLQAEAEELAQERDPGDTQFDEESGEGDTVNVERERDLMLSASARQIVDAIDRALARIEAGTYGVCLPAGRRLSLERLEAIPYAEECVDCKARAERRR